MMKLIKTKFLRELFSEEISLADALEKGKRFDIDLSARFFQILLFKYLQDDVSLQLFEEVEMNVKIKKTEFMFLSAELRVGHF